MNIAFIIPSLVDGGAERVVVTLADYWYSSGHEITLFTFTAKENDFFIPVQPIKRISLSRGKGDNKIQRLINKIHITREFRKHIKKNHYDFIISFLPKANIVSLLASLHLKTRVIVCERNIINDPDIDWLQNFLRCLLYPMSYKISVQHKGIRDELLNTYKSIRSSRVYITPNPVRKLNLPDNIAALKNIEPFCNWKPIILGVGRFTKVKAFTDIIAAFALLSKCKPEAGLILIGDGPEYTACTELVQKLGLSNKVYMPGRITQIDEWYFKADIFVTATHYEGFPNAIAEALSAGLPVVAFSAPSIDLLVQDGYNGYIIKERSIETMAKKIIDLINSQELYQQLSHNATLIHTQYNIETVSKIWFEEVLV